MGEIICNCGKVYVAESGIRELRCADCGTLLIYNHDLVSFAKKTGRIRSDSASSHVKKGPAFYTRNRRRVT